MKNIPYLLLKKMLFAAVFLFFTVHLFAGANPDGSFSSSIPINIPKGAMNIAPNISLEYNSNNGNGMVGVGWQLAGLSYITRINQGSGITYTDYDSYAHSDIGVLVNIGNGIYHSKKESFTKLQPYGSTVSGPTYWVATDKSGVKFYYGYTADSRIEAVGKNGNVRVWALNKVEDLHGNSYEVTYNKDTTNGDYYPAVITYTIGNGLYTYRTIEFGYEYRTDHGPQYQQSALVDMDKRLEWIYVKSAGVLVRKYGLDYRYSPLSKRSQLISFQEYGSNNASALYPTTFSWKGDGLWQLDTTRNSSSTIGTTFSNWRFEDLNADGKLDAIYPTAGGDIIAYFGKTTGKFYTMGAYNTGLYVLQATGFTTAANWRFIDLNNDGMVDAVYPNNGTMYVYLAKRPSDAMYSEYADYRGGRITAVSTSLTTNSNWQFADVNGDGIIDAIYPASDGRIYTCLGNGNGTFSSPITAATTSFTTNTNWRFVDINGDGRVDAVYPRSDAWIYFHKGNANGTFGASTSRNFSGMTTYTNWRFVDINGDGMLDAVYPSSNGVMYVYFGQGNNVFSSPITALNTPAHTDHTNWRFVDMDGDGRLDAVYPKSNGEIYVYSGRDNGVFAPATSILYSGLTTFSNWRFADINGDGIGDAVYPSSDGNIYSYTGFTSPRDVIADIYNGIGGSTSVTYVPAPQVGSGVGRCYLQNARVDTSPRLLATKITQSDGRGHSYSTSYGYYGGAYSPGTIANRTSLGFSQIRTYISNTNISIIRSYRQDKPYQMQQSSEIINGPNSYNMIEVQKRVDYSYDVYNRYSGTELVRNTKIKSTIYYQGTAVHTTTIDNGYDAYGNTNSTVKSAADRPTVTTTTEYDNYDSTWILGRVKKIEVTSDGSVMSRVEFGYGNNNVTSKTEWRTAGESHVTSMGHDANGNVTSVTDARGHTTTTEYDDTYKASIKSITNHLGYSRQVLEFNNQGLPVKEQDENGAITQTDYDVFGRVKKVTKPDGGYVQTDYLNLGNAQTQYKQTTVNMNSSQTMIKKEYFDGMEFSYRTETTGDNGTIYVDREKDSVGRDYRTSLPYYSGETPKYTKVEYDGVGRKNKITAPDGTITNISYGANTMTITDAKGKVTTKTYNAADKIASIKDANNNITSYQYDAFDRLTDVTLPDGSLTSIAYDWMNNKTSIIDPNTGTTTFEYNGVGKLTKTTNASGKVIIYYYDELDRLKTKDLPSGEQDVVYTYDETGVSNSKGKLTTKVDEAGTWKYSYDTKGRLKTSKLTIDGKNYTTTYNYDLGDRLTSIIHPDGSEVEYAYTTGGNLNTVLLNDTTVATWSNYNAEGKPKIVTYGNGVVSEYDYATMGQIKTLTTKKGTTVLQNLGYQFDEVGNVKNITDNRSVKTISGINTDATQAFVYDDLYRLTDAQGVYGSRTYASNAVGNLTNKNGMTITYNGNRATGGTNFTGAYDAVGNMTKKVHNGVTTDYVYDSQNRLKQVKVNGVLKTQMVYDDSGQRVKKVYYGSSVMTTTYVSPGYEVRKQSGGFERHTINISGNGHMTMSKTQEGTIAVAKLDTYRQYMNNAAFFGGDVIGLAKKAYYTVQAYINHPLITRYTFVAILAVMVLAFFAIFGIYQLHERRKKATTGKRYSLAHKLASFCLSLMLLLSITMSGCNHFGSDLTPNDTMSVEELVRALSGDTSQGLPAGTYYYHKNHIGSSSVITNISGAEVTRISYLPYGEIDQAHSVGGDNVTYKFTGQEYDSEIGLHYYNARYYDAAIGRFITADAFVQDGEDCQSYNRYSYVRNNPINYMDPTGHFFSALKKVFKSVVRHVVNIVKSVVNVVVDIHKAVYKAMTGFNIWKKLWDNEIIRSVIIAVAVTALTILSGGAALTLGPLVMAGLKAAIVSTVMQSKLGQNMIRSTANVLHKWGMSERAANIFGSIIATVAVSYGVNMGISKLSGTTTVEMSSEEAMKMDESMTGSQCNTGRTYREILYSDAANDPMTHFYKVLDNQGNLVGAFAETPIFKWMGTFGPMHTAAWTVQSGLGASLGFGFKAVYGAMGVCQNSATILLQSGGAYGFSPVQLGFSNAVQYSLTQTIYGSQHVLTGEYGD